MLGWITRWLPKKKSLRAPTTSRPFRTRLGVELLGARINPVNNIWKGTSDDFSNDNFWSLGHDPLPAETIVVQPRLVPVAATVDNPNPPPTLVSVNLTFYGQRDRIRRHRD